MYNYYNEKIILKKQFPQTTLCLQHIIPRRLVYYVVPTKDTRTPNHISDPETERGGSRTSHAETKPMETQPPGPSFTHQSIIIEHLLSAGLWEYNNKQKPT